MILPGCSHCLISKTKIVKKGFLGLFASKFCLSLPDRSKKYKKGLTGFNVNYKLFKDSVNLRESFNAPWQFASFNDHVANVNSRINYSVTTDVNKMSRENARQNRFIIHILKGFPVQIKIHDILLLKCYRCKGTAFFSKVHYSSCERIINTVAKHIIRLNEKDREKKFKEYYKYI